MKGAPLQQKAEIVGPNKKDVWQRVLAARSPIFRSPIAVVIGFPALITVRS